MQSCDRLRTLLELSPSLEHQWEEGLGYFFLKERAKQPAFSQACPALFRIKTRAIGHAWMPQTICQPKQNEKKS